MLVHISDDVAEQGGSLLKNIKEHLSKASLSLWKATGNMQRGKAAVQFGTVFIRIPRTWKTSGDHITWQQCNKADFFITTHRENDNQLEPFTKQLGECGEKAEFTKFSEKFFKSKNEKDLFSASKIIMTEFVKLRYGVFSEKPYGNMLTYFNGTTFNNSTCGANIEWTINKPAPLCSDRNKVCKYSIKPNQHHNYSVMFDNETPESEYFCNDNDMPHNKDAQSLHNIKCNKASVSAVILRHDDFRPSLETLKWEDIQFKIIKGQPRKIVLVLDVSGSMFNIIENMKMACVQFIERTVEESAFVGLVTFSDAGVILSDPTPMNKMNKRILVNLINKLIATGGTNIPSGIEKGVEALGGSIFDDKKTFGMILLLSDGENSVGSSKYYQKTIEQVIKKGIVANTIAYGDEADQYLDRLARGSGGLYHYVDTKLPYVTLLDKFENTHFCEASDSHKKMIEATTTMELSGIKSQTNLTFIDKYIGMDLQITNTLSRDVTNDVISIVNPEGRLYSHSQIIKQSTGTTLIFDIPGQPVFGMYKLQIEDKSSHPTKSSPVPISIAYRVSAISPRNSRIIRPTGQLSSSYIDQLTESSTVKVTVDLTTCGIESNENVTVILSMITTNRNITFPMTDDGLGDDSIENDKLFTKVLISKDLLQEGFYTFSANVEILNKETNEIITRNVEIGGLRIHKTLSKPYEDRVPPAKIQYVNIVIVSSQRKELNIEILSTGNDGTIGNISDYEIKITSSKVDFIKRMQASAPPGSKISFLLSLHENVANPFDVYVRGIDDKQNAGDWSFRKTSNWNYNTIAEKYELFVDNNGSVSHFYFFLLQICAPILFTMLFECV